MKKELMNFAKETGNWMNQRSSIILTGLALTSLAATIVSAYKAGVKIDKILTEKKEELKMIDESDKEARKAVVKETVKEVSLAAIPTMVSGATTGACILGLNKTTSKKIAVLSAACTASEKAVTNLNNKMNEVLGEKKARSIKDAIVKDNVMKDGIVKEGQVILTGDGDVLCKDLHSGRYFRSNASKIQQAINSLSADCAVENYVELNELYELLNIPRIPLGDDLGWNADDLVRGQLPITISAQLTEDNQPCLCLDYDISVRRDFRNLH